MGLGSRPVTMSLNYDSEISENDEDDFTEPISTKRKMLTNYSERQESRKAKGKQVRALKAQKLTGNRVQQKESEAELDGEDTKENAKETELEAREKKVQDKEEEKTWEAQS